MATSLPPWLLSNQVAKQDANSVSVTPGPPAPPSKKKPPARYKKKDNQASPSNSKAKSSGMPQMSDYMSNGRFDFKKASHDEKVYEKKALAGDKNARQKELRLEAMLKRMSGHSSK